MGSLPTDNHNHRTGSHLMDSHRPHMGNHHGGCSHHSMDSRPRSDGPLPVVLAIIVGTLILACGGCFAAIFLVTFNSPPAIVAKQYYNAIKSQDYARAYSYLDPNNEITFGGRSQQITQQAFTQAAQAYDATKGKVSDFSITSVDLNYSDTGNTGHVTVRVTRNGNAYEVHLELRQEGNDWKIISFDDL